MQLRIKKLTDIDTMSMWRQGDLLIQTTDSIPENLKKQKALTLLASRISGHSHSIAEKRTCRIYQDGDEWYLDVFAETASLVHPEHGTIDLAEGKYRVWRQREFGSNGVNRFVLD